MSKNNPVVHFEMGYLDRERMKAFYTSAFGWNMQQLGEEMGGYVVAQTVVIAVPDIKAAIEAVKASGGTILGAMDASGNRSMEPHMIPGIGLWISIQDTEGNRVSLLQPLPLGT